MEWKDKKVLVFGTGLSGIGAAGLLERVGACPLLYDGNEKVKEEQVRAKLPEGSRARIFIGKMDSRVLEGITLAVLSPGVPTDLPEVEQIREAGIPIWGEVELAYENSRGDVLAITGTNGKTTTTALVGEIMKHHQEHVFVVGNIGSPYTDAALDTTDDSVAVAEISSFQLETVVRFHPRVSAITNITPDHLNRHHTMEEYIRVKESITKNQVLDVKRNPKLQEKENINNCAVKGVSVRILLFFVKKYSFFVVTGESRFWKSRKNHKKL